MKRQRWNIVLACAGATVALTVIGAVLSAGFRERDWETLELSLADNPTTLDPALIKDVSGGRLAALLYPTLVRYDEEARLVGDLAEDWDVSADGLTYRFRLRKGARFSDGTPIGARDVAASFERALCAEVASPRSWVLADIRGAREFRETTAAAIEGLAAEGDGAVRITLTKPSGTFLSLLTMPSASVLPAATVRKPFWGVDNLPVAGGPFHIAKLEPDVSLTLEANPNYYGVPPTVKRIRYRMIRNPFAAVAEFRQGRLDVIEVPDAFDEFFLGDPERSRFTDSVEGLNTYYLGFNCTRAPFDNRDFRRGICQAIDRAAIIDNILHGKAAPAAGPIPPGLSGYDARFVGWRFDPEMAGKSIVAGGGSGRTLEILVLSNADTIVVAEAISGQLKAAGLPVEVTPREKGTFKALLRDGDFDMVYYSWVADYPDGENFLTPLFGTSPDRSGGNYTAYSNPLVDDLLARAAATVDAAKRAELYRQTARIVVEDAPRALLWHARRVTVKQPWLTGYRPTRIYNAERFESVRIIKPGT